MEPGLVERGHPVTGRVPGHEVAGPAVFAILLGPCREQLLLVLQAIFESGSRR